MSFYRRIVSWKNPSRLPLNKVPVCKLKRTFPCYKILNCALNLARPGLEPGGRWWSFKKWGEGESTIVLGGGDGAQHNIIFKNLEICTVFSTIWGDVKICINTKYKTSPHIGLW